MALPASPPDHELLVVLRDAPSAEQAVEELEAAGVPGRVIGVGEQHDLLLSIRAEMREELAGSWMVPPVGVAPSEAARGFVAVTIVLAVIGAVVAAPFAFIDFGLTFWGRLIMLVGIGLAFGVAVGIVVGPALASKRPEEPSAVDRGIVMHVGYDTPAIRNVLARFDPIRIDRVDHGVLPRGTIRPEHGSAVADTVEELREGFDGDDFRGGTAS
jgi:hypothetical protein